MVKKKPAKNSPEWYRSLLNEKPWYERTVREHLKEKCKRAGDHMYDFNVLEDDARTVEDILENLQTCFPKGSNISMKITEVRKICDQLANFAETARASDYR